MKNLHRCPKCDGKRIWVIEKFRIPSESVVRGLPLAVLPHQPAETASFFGLEKVNPQGQIDLYLCDGCGYSELWAEGFRGLVASPQRGVRLLDTSDAQEGPFR